MNGSQKLTFRQKMVVALLPSLLLLLTAEGVVRVYYARHYGHSLFIFSTPKFAQMRMPEYHYAPRGQSWTTVDPCSGRTLVFTGNSQRARGKEWTLAKPKDTLRILAVGGSDTFGINSPDGATWPAFLEASLRRQGRRVEVFNGGWPRSRLMDVLHWYSVDWRRYKPDLMVCYLAYNDTWRGSSAEVVANVLTIHNYTWAGRLTKWLYFRSMLYTYLLEKSQFWMVSRNADTVVPDIRKFQEELKNLVRMCRQNGTTPVFVLQCNNSPQLKEVRHLDLQDKEKVRSFILEALNNDPRAVFFDALYPKKAKAVMLKLYQAQVLVETLRRAGEEWGIQVIDPRQSVIRYKPSQDIFCDEIHLSDRGNRILAETIAEFLALPEA